MPKSKSPATLAAELLALYEAKGYKTGTLIAEFTGIPQYRIWRCLFGKPPKRYSKTLKELCDNAGIDLSVQTEDPRNCEILMKALNQVWDGTERHAQQIASLLFASDQMRMRR